MEAARVALGPHEGEAIFRSSDAQCASCHGEDGRTPDGMRHHVGSRAPGDQRRELDTPSLAFVGGSAPCQPVQIEGTVPATGKRYLVNASVAQTARDPEPLLSVTARLLER